MDRNLFRVLKVLVLGPLLAGLIFVDRYVFRRRNPFLRIPRTVPELVSPPDRMFRLLRDHAAIPADARFVSCDHQGGADSEPDKNVARLEVVYSTPASGQVSAPIFVKLPSARRYKIVLKAVAAALGTGAKEVAFHNVVFPELARQAGGREALGFAAPRNLWSEWKRPFDRTVLVQECVDMSMYHSRPDWKNADAAVVQRIVDSALDLHRRTWQLRNVPRPVVEVFPERGGVDWLDGPMSLYIRGTSPSCQAMWSAIKRRTAEEPATISHGDCRLGNCLFTSDYSDVILTDWELNSITFYLWDISYCMICSFDPADRRTHERSVIARYLEALAADPANTDVPSLERAMELHRVCMVIIQMFGWLISRFGGVGTAQGNSDDDMASWKEKLEAAMTDALADEAAMARALDVDPSLVRQFREDYASGRILDISDV